MPPSPLVSVILPIWNAEATLPRCLDSLFNQTVRDLEVVAIDDGSTDATPRLLRAAARQDDRLVVVTIPHGGIVAALQAGLAHSRAHLVARMDADDVALPCRLERQISLLHATEGPAVIGCQVALPPETPSSDGMAAYLAWQNEVTTHDRMLAERFIDVPLVHPTLLLERRTLERVGGYRDGPWPEDYDLVLRLLAGGVKAAKVPEVLLWWGDPPTRLTRVDPRCAKDNHRVLKATHLEAPIRARGGTVSLWNAGKLGKRWARLLHDRGISVSRLFDIDAKKIGRAMTRQGLVVQHIDDIVARDDELLLVAVSFPDVRGAIRRHLAARGMTEGEGWFFVE